MPPELTDIRSGDYRITRSQTGKHRTAAPEQVWADLSAGAQARAIQPPDDAAEAVSPNGTENERESRSTR